MASIPAELKSLGKLIMHAETQFGDEKRRAVFTSEEHAQVIPAGERCVLAKNLFMKDKKKKYYVVVMEHSRAVDLKALGKQAGAASGGWRMSQDLEKILGVTRGAVTPLAVLNDAKHEVVVVFDKALLASDCVGVHPCSNEATLIMKGSDIQAFVEGQGNTFKTVDLGPLPAGGSAAAAPAPAAAAAPAKSSNKKKSKKEAPAKKQQPAPKKKGKKQEKKHELALSVAKEEDFATWYSQLVIRSEMIEYYDISGCYILRPWSYKIWDHIKDFFDAEIQKLGVENCYFPIFVSKAALCAEEDHIEGFAPEVAWVTKSGQSDLEEHIAVRPTSETIMYPAYSKWIRSYRDLPLKLNQWNNVVRWEFKDPTPFIRSREFLWQEGHTAYATHEEAAVEVLQILNLYARIYEDLLCVPVIKGKKTEHEKFAGGDYTTTVEAFIPAVGRGIQGATSHCLGQNFAKMFNIEYTDENLEKQMVWQNSWGCTTRTIGVMIMVHSDDKGLVLPPRVAPLQVVLVPITFAKNAKEEIETTYQTSIELVEELKAVGVRAKADVSTTHNPGWKFNNWEMKGVPIRLELGPKDLAAKQVVAVMRHDGSKHTVAWADLKTVIPRLLRQMQTGLLAKARAELEEKIVPCLTWEQFMDTLDNRAICQSPWCGVEQCEKDMKTQSGVDSKKRARDNTEDDGRKLTGAAKSLCIPFAQPDLPKGSKCVGCGKGAIMWCLFGRSY